MALPRSSKDEAANKVARLQKILRTVDQIASLDVVSRSRGLRGLTVELRSMAQLAAMLSPEALGRELSERLEACATRLEKAVTKGGF